MRPSFLLYELAGSHDPGEDFNSSKGWPVPRNWGPWRHESFAKQILLPGYTECSRVDSWFTTNPPYHSSSISAEEAPASEFQSIDRLSDDSQDETLLSRMTLFYPG